MTIQYYKLCIIEAFQYIFALGASFTVRFNAAAAVAFHALLLKIKGDS